MSGMAYSEAAVIASETSAVRGVAALSALEREFARDFVLNGGNATRAAVTAGYSDSDPGRAGRRCLLRPRVLAEIKRLSVVNAAAYLPMAVRTLIEIACDPEQPAKARVDAANSLLDRGGMAAPKGGVQVNVAVGVNGSEAQTLIGSVWSARTDRLASEGGERSGILSTMPDILEGVPITEQHPRREPANPLLPASRPSPAPHDGGGASAKGPGAVASNTSVITADMPKISGPGVTGGVLAAGSPPPFTLFGGGADVAR